MGDSPDRPRRNIPGLLAAAVIGTLLAGCGRVATPSRPHFLPPPPITCIPLKSAEAVQAAVNDAASHPNAVFLVSVDWAPMDQQLRRLNEFAQALSRRYPSTPMVFRCIDCTAVTNGYAPLRALPGWEELEARNQGVSLIHGYGEFVWLKGGKVMRVLAPDKLGTIDAMIAKTVSLGMTH